MVRFMARLTDGCDIPKLSALQSCIFPVAKYRSVATLFISRLIGLFLLVGMLLHPALIPQQVLYPHDLAYYLLINSVFHCLQNILPRSHFPILCE